MSRQDLIQWLAALILASLLAGCGDGSESSDSSEDGAVGFMADRGREGFVELDWDALIPEEWRPETLLAELGADDIPDEDPRAEEIMDKLMALWKTAPVVPELDGTRVRLPGFMVPLDFDVDAVSEFLLVPYYGACIHVPPPPANQTVHVVMPKGRTHRGGVFDVLWVSGILRVQAHSHEIADAGYRIDAIRVEPYE